LTNKTHIVLEQKQAELHEAQDRIVSEQALQGMLGVQTEPSLMLPPFQEAA
ncbi:hypothetical protein HispidOSU_018573, partial [Sigmodon hispidus]